MKDVLIEGQPPVVLIISDRARRVLVRRFLDTLGVYAHIRAKGYNFETIAYKDTNYFTLDTYLLGLRRFTTTKSFASTAKSSPNCILCSEKPIPSQLQEAFLARHF